MKRLISLCSFVLNVVLIIALVIVWSSGRRQIDKLVTNVDRVSGEFNGILLGELNSSASDSNKVQKLTMMLSPGSESTDVDGNAPDWTVYKPSD